MNMNKAMWERVHGTPYQIDDTDKAILAARIVEWEKRQGPRVGDFVVTSRGLLRFTHDWGDEVQTTVPHTHPCASDVSFYLTEDGYMSFSGSLDDSVPKSSLSLTTEIRQGSCWFFSHNHPEAHNDVYVQVPCRVWKLQEGE